MEIATFFEAFMLVCFGISWPVSAYRSYKARTAKGKSLLFLILIELGYIGGLVGKIFFNPSWVIAVYVCNMFFVTLDLCLYFRNVKLDKAGDKK